MLVICHLLKCLQFLVNDEHLLEAHQPGTGDRIGSRQTGHFTVYLRSPCVIKHNFPVKRHLLDSDLGKRVNGGHPRPEDEAESLEQERERDMWREAWCRNTESGESTPLVQI